MKKTKVLWLTVLVAFLSISKLMLMAEGEKEKGKHSSVFSALEEWKSKEPDIVFYGRIVDLDSNLLENVLVSVDVPEQIGFRQRKSREIVVQTDKDGRFQVDANKYDLSQLCGSFLFIRTIKKSGYEYLRQRSPHSFTYRKDHADRFVPDKQKPVVFYLREKQTPTLLIHNDHLQMKIEAKESGCVVEYDSIQKKITPAKNLNSSGDLLLQANFDEYASRWQVLLSATGTNGGIMANTNWMAEAPKEGYEQEYTFVAENHKVPSEKYLYVRSRDPSVYSRYEIEYINANEKFFRLSGKSVTNPYGDRNLEQATGLPYGVVKKLTDDAKAAFSKNQRPKKPDIKALIKAEKAKK